MYQIRWLGSVTHDLLQATSVAGSSIRDRILNAMAEAESVLENDPEFVGESREHDDRFVIVPPLSITYKIDAKNRIVTVLKASVHRAKD